jgi:multidrug transporter EmrE-like cation transporter
MIKVLFFSLVFVAVLFEAAADIYFKKWSMESRNILLGIGMALYTVGTLIWAYSLKYEFLSKAISIFTILNLIVIVLVGVLFFKEELTTLNILGIILGVISVSLLSF